MGAGQTLAGNNLLCQLGSRTRLASLGPIAQLSYYLCKKVAPLAVFAVED